jgi:hypothetical protein
VHAACATRPDALEKRIAIRGEFVITGKDFGGRHGGGAAGSPDGSMISFMIHYAAAGRYILRISITKEKCRIKEIIDIMECVVGQAVFRRMK